MEPQTPIPVFLPFVGGSSGTAAFLPAVWQEAESQPEREFFDRLPEEEQQRMLRDCATADEFRQLVRQAMRKQ